MCVPKRSKLGQRISRKFLSATLRALCVGIPGWRGAETARHWERVSTDSALRPMDGRKPRILCLLSAGRTLPLVLCLLACGCAATREVRRARTAMAQGRPILARGHLESAARLSPKRLRDPEFREKLRIARRDARHAEGAQLARGQKWDAALNAFEDVLEIESGWPDALRSIAETKQWAAAALHQQALAQADMGRARDAAASAARALTYVPDHPGAQQAHHATQFPEADETRGGVHYRIATQHITTQRWPEAAEALREATVANPNHLPARARLFEAKERVSRAKALFDKAVSALEQHDLGEAESAFSRSLDVTPHAGRTAERLEHVKQLIAHATKLTEQAQDHLAHRRWDSAIKSAGNVLQLWSTHPQAEELRSTAASGAARDAITQGRELLKQAHYTRAEREFERALTYRPDSAKAKESLSDAALARARSAEVGEAWGAALLWRITAQQRHQRKSDSAEITRTITRVLNRLQTDLSLAVLGPGGKIDADALDLAQGLRDRLQAKLPSFIQLSPADLSGKETNVDYELRLECLGINIDQEVIQRASRTHLYNVEHRFPNVEIARTRELIHSCEHQVTVLSHRLTEAESRLHHLRRSAPPTPRHPKKHDASTGGNAASPSTRHGQRGRHETGEADQDNAHHGGTNHAHQGEHHAHAKYAEHQRREQHLQSQVNRCRRDLDNERRELRRLRRRLDSLPRTIVEVHRKTWPYVRVTERKTGRLVARLNLVSTKTGKPAAEQVFEVSKQDQDDAIENPNPDIGLKSDPLILRTNQSIRGSLLNAASIRTAEAAIDMVHEQIRLRLEQERDAVRGQDLVSPQRLEREVTAILARQARGSTSATADLEQLRQTLEERASKTN
ncbi:MAG: tetratricopeptide repeat protein [Lentisphaerae bacterium]|jgi:tetratricopeptide (TPR) repeat protein|nr:tetratricopeptide repeat protein [Lentisphaerota bacterium]MBT4822775.1 tetratricopeptide repeat protein [Lentisphaerota bacterium]MBT5606887.1 tetratricopeptide repeat protein [Lentisphaerota bacterium]MBT7058333.1 tetratricopeptide repeat protein [Lentisphaerota bacterium]MBT7843606.1 tetratricopeptide repeat protein [Lentisphaerota bacterium]